jgi:hypothetical protein
LSIHKGEFDQVHGCTVKAGVRNRAIPTSASHAPEELGTVTILMISASLQKEALVT